MFRFQSPYFFLLLIPWAILLLQCEYRLFFKPKRRQSILFSNLAVLRNLPRSLIQRTAPFVPYLFYVGTALWIAALARPQFGQEEYRVRSEGIALMVCIDRSNSMAAVDFTINRQPANRLEAVKQTLHDFIQGNGSLAGRQDDAIGLLAFGGYVDAHCPLTLDHTTLLEMLDQIQLPNQRVSRRASQDDENTLAEEGATAIGDALAMAADRLRESEAKSKVILFLSDGEQTFGELSPMQGVEIAKAFGIKIYTIGIGSNGEAPYPFADRFGNVRTVMQRVSMDEETLKAVADATGGTYFNARNTKALEDVYTEIDRLEKTTLEGSVYTRYSEQYRYPLVVGSGLILLYAVCICTRFRRLP